MSEYETRAAHGENSYHSILIENGKPIAIILTEPDKKGLSDFFKYESPKITVTELK